MKFATFEFIHFQVTDGMDVVRKIEAVGSGSGTPSKKAPLRRQQRDFHFMLNSVAKFFRDKEGDPDHNSPRVEVQIAKSGTLEGSDPVLTV